jgi:hypothetical protein
MHSEQLFEVALGVSSPWYVREARFDADARRTFVLEVASAIRKSPASIRCTTRRASGIGI